MSLKIFVYENSSISFNDGENLMVSATQMAKAFGKAPAHWFSNAYTTEVIHAIAVAKGGYSGSFEEFEHAVCDTLQGVGGARTLNTTKLAAKFPTLIKVVRGGTAPQGTWMNEDVALEFARWLSPKFAIWCNDCIKELLKTGQVSLPQSEDQVILAGYRFAMQKIDRLEIQNTALLAEVSTLAPKAEVYDKVMDSGSLLNATQVAQNLGMSAVALNKALAEKKIQRKMGDGTWVLNADYVNEGLARLVPYPYSVREGVTKTKNNLMWTEKGRQFIAQQLGM